MGFFYSAPANISRVNVIGVRTAMDTKVLATYNSTVYCLLIEFTDGSRDVVEVSARQLKPYLPYIPMI